MKTSVSALAQVAAVIIGIASAAGDVVAAVLPAVVRPGDVFVLRPPPDQSHPESALFLDKRYPPLAVPGEPEPIFLIGLDLDVAPGKSQVIVRRENGSEARLPVSIKQRRFPEERLTLPPAMVTPPSQLEERIAREQAIAAAVYRTSSRQKLWDRGFTPPLGQKAAGNFGRRRILNGVPKSPHSGQDYSAPAGTAVAAIADGTVRLAEELYYSGLTLFVDHGSGLVSVYMHLEQLLAAQGEKVVAGQLIGRVGSTGRATGPHLHLSVRLFEQRVDPETLWGLFGKRSPAR